MRKPNEQLIDSYDYLANAASAQDCTGPVSYTHLIWGMRALWSLQ